MKLHPPLPETHDFPRVFRPSLNGERVGLVVVPLLFLAGAIGLGRSADDIPLFAWVFLGPMVLLFGFVLLLITATFVSILRSARPWTTWLVGLTDDAVYLNLRSYKNAHFGGEDATVVNLDYSEIASVGRVLETTRERNTANGNKRTTSKRRIELRLVDVDTAPLARALWVERYREPRKRRVLGVTTSARHGGTGVHLVAPDCIHLDDVDGLLDALSERIRQAPERKVDLDAELEDLAPEERIVALARRDRRFEARDLARETEQLSKREARDRVEELERNAA